MIGRWAKAASLLLLALAAVVDLGLAAALLDHAAVDLPGSWAMFVALAGPGERLAIAGRDAITGGVAAGAVAGGAALLLGSAAAQLSGATRAVLLALLRLPALTLLLLGLFAAILLIGPTGPVIAALGGFSVAMRPLGARWGLAIVVLPVAVALVEATARRLDHDGFASLATLGVGPLRRLVAIALPAVLPAAIKAAVVGFLIAATCLFVAAWPVAARQDVVAALSRSLPVRQMAAFSFCVAAALAVVVALLTPTAPIRR